MTVYLVPCGLSILDWTKSPDDPPWQADPSAVDDFCDAEERWRARTDHDLNSWKASVLKKARMAGIAEWSSRVSAETSTLSARRSGRRLLEDGDRVVLLASDTGDGVGAALCVAGVVAAGDPGAIAGVAVPGEPLRAGTVTVVRIPGLRPSGAGLGLAAAGIGTVLRAALDLSGATGKVEVHLTGGYKAVLLHTLAMTEVAYSLFPDQVSAHYIFDGSKGETVPIGLRRFPKGTIAQMREELSIAKHGDRVAEPHAFQHLAWVTHGSGSKLTEFGEGYLAVLGGGKVPGSNDGGRR